MEDVSGAAGPIDEESLLLKLLSPSVPQAARAITATTPNIVIFFISIVFVF
jgi:hypothetical protein